MANEEHYTRLFAGVDRWNAWRQKQPGTAPDLSGTFLYRQNLSGADLSRANLSGTNLFGANLSETNLSRADLSRAELIRADLSRANLSGTNLFWANLSEANLSRAELIRAELNRADLSRANLCGANLSGARLGGADLLGANLCGANLSGARLGGADLLGANLSRARLGGADLQSTVLVMTNFQNADLTGCRIYGISAWDLELKGAKQRDLVITKPDEPEITVDKLEVAQFIYLLLHNEKIRDVIDTITSKVVLILGRFTPEHRAVLDALRNILREKDRTPVVFNFDTPSTKNVTDTVKLLAQLARYVIVDLSDPNSAPYELGVISMLGLKTTPLVPIIVSDQKPFPMLENVLQERWSTDLITYQDLNDLMTNLDEKLLKPAEAKVRELRR